MYIQKHNFPIRPSHGKAGSLVALEAFNEIPFDVKRVFYIIDLEDADRRVCHADHKTQLFLVCLQGGCEVLLDNGSEKTTVSLKGPNEGIVIDPYVWHEMHSFESNCLLLVMANTLFDEEDYIFDYQLFLEAVSVCSS